MRRLLMLLGLTLAACAPAAQPRAQTQAQVVTYRAGAPALRGWLYKPPGPGPFPALLYNHGSAPGSANDAAFAAIAPGFVARGWVVFAPYRRGQGLSAEAGPYVMDQIAAARGRGGAPAAAEELVRQLAGPHLADQLAAREWLAAQPFVRKGAIAAMGNSFGGIETLLGAEAGGYCAAVDAAGGAESWQEAPPLRQVMLRAAREAKAPVYFFQAQNDFDTEPSRALFATRQAAGKAAELKIYPPFGGSARDGHSFAYRAPDIWRADVTRFLERHCTAAR